MVEGTTLSVHRCRFVDYTPSAITAIAFPPLPLPSAKGKGVSIKNALRFGVMAVGRANGNIEICEWTGENTSLKAPQAWVVRRTISGPYPSKLDSLAFVLRNPDLLPPDQTPALADLRLFSAGGGRELAEWDLEKGCIRRTVPSQGGSIWCIAPNPSSTLLAIGCEDGAIRLLSLEFDTLTHLRRLDRVKSRILSLAWGPPIPKRSPTQAQIEGNGNMQVDVEAEAEESSDDEDVEDWSDSWLVAGCSDSSLRKWDFATGRVGDRMGTDKLRGERTLVWAVGVLGDGTIVSGDSLGIVKFWDSVTCTQLHSFQAHSADVLCLTIGPEGTSVYTSGVDQKVVQFTHINTQSSSKAQPSLLSRPQSRWIQSSSRRMHSHDVRALATWPPYTPLPPSHKRRFPLDIAPVLASGGLDMSVVVTPAALPASTVTKVVNPLSTSADATFENAYHRRLAYSSGSSHASGLSLARRARLLLCMKDTSVSLWRIWPRKVPSADEDANDTPITGGWEPVLEMDLNVRTNLVASAISDDGRWLVVSDLHETKIWQIEYRENGDATPKRIRDFPTILQTYLPGDEGSTGASCLQFTPDSSKLVMGTSMTGYVLVIDLSSSKPRVLRRFEHHRMRNVVIGERMIKGRTPTPAANAEDADMVDANIPQADEQDSKSDNGSDDEVENIDFSKPLIATVTRMAVSPDSQWLATSDSYCRTHVYNLDSITHHAVLPSFPQPVHALSFDSSQPNILVLGLANNGIHIYDVEARSFPAWARELTSHLPQRFTHLHDPILGVTFDVPAPAGEAKSGPKGALFWGATWLCRVQFDAAVGWGGFEKKRRRDGGGKTQPSVPQVVGTSVPYGEEGVEKPTVQQQNFKLVTHYRPILFVDFIGPAELVVVERPLVDVLAKMPPAFVKPKYGAT